jgi:O-antigen/teichoic acid export membrane protein
VADLTDQPRARSVTRNVLAMVSARVAVALAGLVSLPVVYARLGSDEFGVWVVLSGLATAVALADLGLGSAIVRQVATAIHDGAIGRSRIALGIGLVWGIALAVVGTGVILIAWPWLVSLLNLGSPAASAARWAVIALLFGVLMDGISLPWRGVLEGNQWYSALAWITGGTGVLGAGLAMLAVISGGGLRQLAITVAIASLIRTCLFIALARRCMASMTPTLAGISRADLSSIGGYGLRVQVTSASGAVNVELDRFILTGFFGPSIAGGFDLGGRVVNLSRMVPALALVALFPMAVSRTTEFGTDWLTKFNLAATKYLTAASAIGAAALVACAEPLIRLWLGQPNWWAALNIMILAPAYALNLAAGATGIVSRVEGRPGRETGYALLSVAINLALTWPLLHLFGPKGVPLATAVGITVGTGYFLISYQRVTDRALAPLLQRIWPSLFAATIGALAGIALGWQLPSWGGRLGAAIAVSCQGALVISVSGFALTVIGFLDREELLQVRRFCRIWHRAAQSDEPAKAAIGASA